MYIIEVWEGNSSNTSEVWHWHFRSGGRITADAESFPSKAHAIRAAKAVVRGVCKPVFGSAAHVPIRFVETEHGDITRIEWA